MEGINYWAEIHREYSCRETLVEVRGGSFIKKLRYKTREEFHTKYAIKNEGGGVWMVYNYLGDSYRIFLPEV